MKNTILIFLMIVLGFLTSVAQNPRKEIRSGNKDYREGDYQEAELNYRRAVDHPEQEKNKAFYNLGNALYRQENYDAAQGNFALAADQADDTDQKANAAYNLGNTLMQAQDYQKAIEAYKDALRNQPGFEDARYNLEYARKLLMEQQQNNEQQDNEQENKEQENNEQQDNKQQDNKQQNNEQQNNEQQDNEQQNNEQENREQQNREQQNREQQEQKISKEDAKRMLEALQQGEKETMEKLNRKKVKASRVKIEKDW